MMHRKRILPLILAAALGLAAVGCTSDGDSGGSERAPDRNACDVLGLNTKIISGTKCDPANSPVVQLELFLADGNGALCTGTLLTNEFVLTAAHCFNSQPRALTVGNGTVQTQGAIVYIHPKFGVDKNKSDLVNDVAVVKLSSPLPLPTVPLLRSRLVEKDDIIAIFGYGLDENGNLQVLRSGEMQVDAVDTDHIRSTFDGQASNTCNGDSGGPALAQNSSGAWGIAGITSTGTAADCSKGDNSVFANIGDPSIYDFIKQYVPGVNVL